MAYYSNSSEGSILEGQCARCKYGQKPCPVFLVQTEYNYEQGKDKTGTATKILNTLVSSRGCEMFLMMKEEIDPNQTEIQF